MFNHTSPEIAAQFRSSDLAAAARRRSYLRNGRARRANPGPRA